MDYQVESMISNDCGMNAPYSEPASATGPLTNEINKEYDHFNHSLYELSSGLY
jgi:hypothetical protein